MIVISVFGENGKYTSWWKNLSNLAWDSDKCGDLDEMRNSLLSQYNARYSWTWNDFSIGLIVEFDLEEDLIAFLLKFS